MRQFARPFPIAKLSLEARILYSGFIAFVALGVASSVWLYADSFEGLSARRSAEYYLGAEASPAIGGEPGPALELPSEQAPPSLRLQKPARQVLETFHFHLFTVPVVLLIIGHLFMLTSASTRTKVAILTGASLATLLHLLAPVLIRFWSAGLGWLMPVTALGGALTWAPMLAWPLWEMWRPGARRSEEPAG